MKRPVNVFASAALFSFLLLASPVMPLGFEGISGVPLISPPPALRLTPIEVGEHAQICFRWLGVTVAWGEVLLKEMIKHRGHDVWHVVLTVKTTRFLDFLFPVRDEYHSFIDVENLQSLRFEKIVQEGDYRADEVVEYDHENRIGRYFSRFNKSEKTFLTDTPVLDPIAAVYWFRSHIPMSVGKIIDVPVNYDENNWYVRVPMVSRETLDADEPSQKNVIKMKPYITNLGNHIHEWDETHREMLTGSKITVWVEEGGHRIPLKVHVKVPLIGSVKIHVTGFWSPAAELE
ncbi:MAG: DUF3108 domain-containing protein [Candidatus Omnitrophica bacterium]|nr:DUF3108 domain-containing protein [Candidatus Omnitrophota bacterium]